MLSIEGTMEIENHQEILKLVDTFQCHGILNSLRISLLTIRIN